MGLSREAGSRIQWNFPATARNSPQSGLFPASTFLAHSSLLTRGGQPQAAPLVRGGGTSPAITHPTGNMCTLAKAVLPNAFRQCPNRYALRLPPADAPCRSPVCPPLGAFPPRTGHCSSQHKFPERALNSHPNWTVPICI